MRQIRASSVFLVVFLIVFTQEVFHILRYINTFHKRDATPHQHSRESETEQPYDFINSPMARDFAVKSVDCRKVLNGDEDEITKGRYVTVEQITEAEVDLSMYMELKYSCSKFKRRRGYILHHLTDEERDFPIAFSVLFFKEFHQVEKLLRIIYRPQNSYCLHVDMSSNPQLVSLVRAYADCFDNVVMPTNSVDILWGSFTLSEAEIVCMQELLKRKGWKYFINLTGQEFPLKTNRQIVKILKQFKGANDMWTSPMHSQGEKFNKRWNVWTWGGPPHGINIIKGSSHITVCRAFVEFVTSDRRVADFSSFLKRTTFGEESLWTTLNNDVNLHAPGGFNGTLEDAIRKPWFAREKWWQTMKQRCGGFYQRNICVFGVSDIHRLVQSHAYFANKIFWNYQPAALACLREWMYNRTRDEFLGKYTFDVRHYTNLENVRKMFKNSIQET